MKDCHICSGFRKLGASYCVSLKEHLNKMLCLPEGRAAGTAGLFIYVYMYMVCTHASSATARAGRAVLVPVRLRKVLGDSQSWVVVLGKEKGQRPAPFPGRAPGRSGGFGLSEPLLVFSRASLGMAGGCPHVPTCPGGSQGDWPGLRFCEGPPVPCSQVPARAWEIDVAGDLALTAARRLSFPSTREQDPSCRLVPCSPPTGSVEKVQPLGHGRQAPGRLGTDAGQQGPVSRAESLRSMHSLHLAMFSTSAWSVRSCCRPSMSSRALW